MESYLPVLIYLGVALAVPILITGLIEFLARARRARHNDPAKYLTYESGYPTPPLTGRIPVQFYLVAMLFVIFDVEAAAFYPWAVTLRRLGAFGLWEVVAFVLVLAIGYAYVWKKGGFQWR
ncbi:NADH-quinone oxidoreductase subunit A [Limnochorda pilosa]|uniref:NADH-quinone oxidoreductase subunit n=1 Tax=Limnochorda pilosa TaxID=1555112 RepID=A0A0K2SPL9_LIMPI|nr:NADH-quinone oxidoreductase subunit A [Limnochorda pilosa]BAS28947.1 NADH dehydrogenase subunit 3 [Limnochorda pilosa]